MADLDNSSLTTDQQLENYVSDAVILAPDQKEIRGVDALRAHLDGFGEDVDIKLNHQIVEIESFQDIVVTQGRVIGTAKPVNDPNIYPFETKNIILFKRDKDKALKIWKVIYNSAPVSADKP